MQHSYVSGGRGSMPVGQAMTVRSVLEQSGRRFKSRVACVQSVDGVIQEISYIKFLEDVRALGTYFLHEGLKKKQIALLGKNSYEWIVVHSAALAVGVIIVPLDKELSTKEVQDSLHRITPRIIFYSQESHIKIVKCIAKECGIRKVSLQGSSVDTLQSLIAIGSDLLLKGSQRYERTQIDPNAVAALLFTSGTTSQSKIVMLSNRNITFNMKSGSKPFNIVKEDRFLSVLPLHHMFEYSAGFLTPIHYGASIYFSNGIRYISQELQSFKPTVLIVVPRIVDALYTKITKGIRAEGKTKSVRIITMLSNVLGILGIDLRPKLFHKIYAELGGSLKFMLSGAAPLRGDVLKGMQNLGFSVYQGYGLTECSPAVSLTHAGCNDADSVGMPLSGTKVIIKDPDESGVGEILVKGPHIMLGYYKNKTVTNETIKKRYFHTGDLGIIKPSGCLKVIGRRKNLIVTSGGKKIYPEQIEYLIVQSPAIKEVVVQGIESRHSTKIMATLVLQDVDSSNSRIELEKQALDQVERVNNSLAAYEKIQAVHVRDTDFVRTSTLKVKRHMIKNHDEE